jgi:hypothetical protein
LVLPQPDDEIVDIFELSDGTTEERSQQLVSLQGFAGSPEHAAAVEWQDFINSYDVVAAAAAVDATEDWGGVPERYRHYGVFSLEMVAKVDEITEKHGLSLFGEMLELNNKDEFLESIAFGPIFTDSRIEFMGYQFSSGTFQFDGWGLVDFQFRASRKGVFDNVFLNIRSVDDYTDWNYNNAHGYELVLTQSGYKSLILLETDIFFIAVNIMAGTDSFSQADLENFADMIDFSQLRSEVPDFGSALEERRNELNVAVFSLFSEWVCTGSERGLSPILPMWESDEFMYFEINDDMSFRLWRGDDLSIPDNWSITGEIVSDGHSGYIAEASEITNQPFERDIQDIGIWAMQLRYDDSGSGLLRLYDNESGSSLMFEKSNVLGGEPIATPEPRR